MAISQGLNLKQSQSLVMTPQLQLAIQLLKLNNDELGEFVERELEQNPLLERDEVGEAPVAAQGDAGLFSTETSQDSTAEATTNGVDDFSAMTSQEGASKPELPGKSSEASGTDAADALTPTDTLDGSVDSFDDTWQGAEDAADVSVGSSVAFENWGSGGGGFDSDGEGQSFEDRLVSTETLREHIDRQINIDIHDPQERLIAGALTDHLDEAGYLSVSTEIVAAQLGCDGLEVDTVLQQLHRFEPSGIFARNLKECLSIQLAERRLLDGPMLQMLDNLDVLADGNLAKLAKICRVGEEATIARIKLLRSVDPKPAMGYDFSVAQPITPDVILRPAQAGGWVVELNPENLPRVLVNNRYVATIKNGAMRDKDREYLKDQLQSANWLVRALHQRATTIMKVASTIVERQQAFFTHGVAHMRPLILRDVAEAIEIHESTVSRATRNKFIDTPRGVFELKYFFSASISNSAGEGEHSAEAVRHRIKQMIDTEHKDDIISDDTLVEKLRAEGIDIARRTVAKYRESMSIPSSIKRRRIKQIG